MHASKPIGPVGAWTTVAILNLAYVVSFIDRTILSLLIDPIRTDLNLTDTHIALVQGAAFGLFYIFLGVPFGWVMDRFSRTRVVGLACALWCSMTALCGLASNFAQLFMARVGVGVGEAALSPGAASLIADLFPPARRALAMSIYAIGASCGIGLSLMAGGAITGAIGTAGHYTLPLLGTIASWQAVLVVVGLGGLVVAVAILMLREPPRRTEMQQIVADTEGVVRFFHAHRLRLGLQFMSVALFGLVAYANLSWVPAYFMRIHQWSASEVGFRYGLVFLIFGSMGALLGGLLSGLLARRGVREHDLWVVAAGTIGYVPFGVLAPLAADPWVSLALFVPAAMCFAMPTGASIAAIQKITPGTLLGQVAAIYYLIVGAIGIVGGPLAVVLTAELLPDPRALGQSLALTTMLFGIAAALCALGAIRWGAIGSERGGA